MEAAKRIFVRNSESRTERQKRGLLAVSKPLFCPCELEEAENGFYFCFETAGLWEWEAVQALETEEKLRLLLNCAALETLTAHYVFALTPENLLFDRNLCPRVLIRDIRAEAARTENFFRAYRALTASVLSRRYGFSDFSEGGERLFQAEPVCRELLSLESVAELVRNLTARWERERKRCREETVRISVRRARILGAALPLCGAVILCLSALWFFSYRVRLRQAERLLAAQEAYLREDYLAVTAVLGEIKAERLSPELRYLFARAAVFTEGLTPRQRENVLSSLHVKSEESLLSFWIFIAQNRFAEALDAAKRRDDSELQLYALLKEESLLASRRDLTGEEREAEAAEISAAIEALRKKRAETGGGQE